MGGGDPALILGLHSWPNGILHLLLRQSPDWPWDGPFPWSQGLLITSPGLQE